MWGLGEPALLGDTPEPPLCRELRKSFGERAHSGPVMALACPADGQLVWSASSKGVLLWDAACGAFLGMLHRSSARLGAQPSRSDFAAAGDGDRDNPERRYKVDSCKVGGRVVERWGDAPGACWRAACLPACSPACSASIAWKHHHLLDACPASSAACLPLTHRSLFTPPPAPPAPLQGLETDPITGYVVARPPSGEWARIAAEQETWAAQVPGVAVAGALQWVVS